MDLPSLSTRLQDKVMRNSSSPSWETSPDGDADDYPEEEENGTGSGLSFRPPGICVPRPLSQTEFDDIQRCFLRANARVEGYLDCSELKVYMDLRKCPITQWEAEKLLEYADPTYHYYITLQQVTNLALHFGIGTQHPIRLTRSEFEVAIERAFRGGMDACDSVFTSRRPSSTQVLDFEGVVNYFESRAEGLDGSETPEEDRSDDNQTEIGDEDDSYEDDEPEPPPTPVIQKVRISEKSVRSRGQDQRRHHYDHAHSSPRSEVRGRIQTREVGSQTDYAPIQQQQTILKGTPSKGQESRPRGRRPKTKTTPTLPRVILDESDDEEDEKYIDEEPLEPVRFIAKKWENKIRHLIDTNGDDYLVKLDQDRRQNEAIMGKSKSKRHFLKGGRKTLPKSKPHPHPQPTSSKRISKKSPRIQTALDNAPILTYRTMRHTPVTPTVKSIFRRETQQLPLLPPFPAGHKLKRVVDGVGVRREGQAGSREQFGQGKGLKQRQPPPPLPPPIVPELPMEFRSRSGIHGRWSNNRF